MAVFYEDGNVTVDDGSYTMPIMIMILAITGTASRSESTELEFPDDAIIERAVFDVTAAVGGSVTLESVGDVRTGASNQEVIVDFGGMTTVRSVYHPEEPDIKRWNGVEFVNADDGEIQSERLLLSFEDGVNAASVGAGGSLVLPAVPDGLELLVDGVTAWHERQGSTAGLTAPTSAGKGFAVDMTEPISDALAASGGPVRVELRALTSGQLTMQPQVEIYRVHRVAFPEGPSRTITTTSEGPFTLDLPLPSESSAWTIESVDLVASGSLPPDRVVPPVGPSFSADARLRLKPGRPILARLTTAMADLGGMTRGLRVPIRGGLDGGELAGRILADLNGRPGDPVAELTPTTIEPGDEPTWVTLMTSQPTSTSSAWLELVLSYGTAEWELAPSGPLDPEAEIHHRKPGGAIRPLTELDSVGALRGALRLVTEPSDNHPIGALSVGLGSETGQQIQLTPSSGGLIGRFGNSSGIEAIQGVLPLQGTVSVAGSYTFSEVTVTYRENAS